MSNQYVDNAKEEIKRADHLIYISLKYTRTCDIIMNIIARLIESYDELIFSSLDKLNQDLKIKNVPESKLKRAEELSKLKRSFKKHLDLYFLLRRIQGSDFDRREEYRKNVTLISHISPTEKLEVTVPLITDYFKKTKEFLEIVEDFVDD